jgi:hypothetical protein
MDNYWNNRFIQEGMIWGTQPSPTALMAKTIFQQHELQHILVPGAGYGRNTKALSSSFAVDAIECSSEAIALAEQWDPGTRFFRGSVLETQT